MNRFNLTYRQSPSNATLSGILLAFTFTGKEKDEETGYSYFGARYYDADLLTGWMSVDPMSDKYPYLSTYAYCAWDPINLMDPDGNDGVKIIDKQKQSITVMATYYVTSHSSTGTPHTYYSLSEIESMQKDINNTLNSRNYIYEIDGQTYNVYFDLNFVAAGESWKAEAFSDKDPIGNCIFVFPEKFAPHIFEVRDNGNGTETHIGAITENQYKITMNAEFDNNRNRIHEIFHTLFFNNDDSESGIGNYVPGIDMPTQDDINKLLSNSQLPEIII